MLTLFDLLPEEEEITVKKPCMWIEDWEGYPFCYLRDSYHVEIMECLGFKECQISERIRAIKKEKR